MKIKYKFNNLVNVNKNSFNIGLVGLALVINGVIGAIGYWLRFYSVYRLEPSIYSILSFFGIIMAYIYGIMFDNESINWMKIAAILLIILSNFLIL
jgi:drug/metabolite transporter (DMT)-like permease